MNLNTVMNEIGSQLDTITGLRVHDYPADSITPPAAVLGMPDEILFDQTYGRGSDKITLPLVLVVGRASDRASRDNLAAYANGSGASSIKAVLEAGTYTAFHTLTVTRAEFDVVRIAGTDYLAALFDLEVFGQGS